jgi:flagella basal body P-ring formation protein FlgA
MQSQLFSKILKLSAICIIFSALQAHAAETAVRPKVIVRPHTTVSTTPVKLGNIAHISSHKKGAEKMVEALSGIIIGDAPEPKTSKTLLGTDVLEKITNAGFSVEAIGYSIPRTVVLERHGRLLTQGEVLSILKNSLSKNKQDRNLRVRGIRFPHDHIIPVGETKIRVDRLGKPTSGKLPLRISVTVNTEESARFLAHAIVDYWHDIPVISRTLERGMLISPEDVQMIRLNMTKQPVDVVSNLDLVVGKRAKTRLVAGNTVRTSQIDIPPTVERGALVTIIHKSRGIQATASGKTLSAGLTGELIMVQNTSSKRLVRARIINDQEVEVSAK